jgi:hypothetical protein
MAEHHLKIAPPWFEAVASGHKTVELRREDGRRFEPGDVLVLREYQAPHLVTVPPRPPEFPTEDLAWVAGYTGRTCRVHVTHVLRHDDVPDLLPPGVAALSIRLLQVEA